MPESTFPAKFVWRDKGSLNSFGAFLPAQIIKAGGAIAESIILTPNEEQQISLEEGPYLIRAQLPSGVFSSQQFTIEGDKPAPTVELEFLKRRRRLPSLKGANVSSLIREQAFVLPEVQSATSNDAEEPGPLSFYEYIDSTTPKVEDTADLPQWHDLWIRLWQFAPGAGWSHVELVSEVTRVSFDEEVLILRWQRPLSYLDELYPFYIELGGTGALSRFTAVPPCRACDLVIRTANLRNEANKGVTLRVVGSDPLSVRSQALLQYLQAGAFDAASATFDQLAKQLLYDDYVDPFGATVGGYFIMKTGRLKASFDWSQIGRMLDAFERRFYHLPDTALLRAWFYIEDQSSTDREATLAKAKALLLEAVDRGVPLFIIGLRYILDMLDSLASNPGTAPHNVERLNEGVSILRRYAQASDDAQVLTTFFARAPWVPSPGEPGSDLEQIVRLSIFSE